jgi:hypothetical protein
MDIADGKGLAAGALLTVLMETLVKNGTLNKFQAFNIITATQKEIADFPHSPALGDAKLILQRLLLRFPPQ